MIDPVNSIESLIPQRPPFVMIDQLTWYDEKITRTVFLIKEDNIFVENKKFCEPGLVENIAQTAAARAGYLAGLQNKPVQLGYIGAVKDLVIHRLPWVNDELETEITIENQIFDVMLINGKVSCNGVLLATCEMKIFITQTK
ncbi:MAG: 3-hydroxyacyl-ACP dehydratase [Ferruginibacter sp.]|nr:3-hydroxyacyl-ACP dehydratase [Ferruginibacter sp.]